MSLKKIFSGLTLFGVFAIGTIMMIGLIDKNIFVYVYIPFMLLIGTLFFVYLHEYLEEKGDKIILGVCLFALIFVASFFVGSFKGYADALQNNEPIIKAQIAQNNELANSNNYNLQVAESLKTTLAEYEKKSVELNTQLNTLLGRQDEINNYNANYVPPVIEEIIYEEPIPEPVYENYVYNYERDDD